MTLSRETLYVDDDLLFDSIFLCEPIYHYLADYCYGVCCQGPLRFSNKLAVRNMNEWKNIFQNTCLSKEMDSTF
jgi:hypothetical protein